MNYLRAFQQHDGELQENFNTEDLIELMKSWKTIPVDIRSLLCAFERSPSSSPPSRPPSPSIPTSSSSSSSRSTTPIMSNESSPTSLSSDTEEVVDSRSETPIITNVNIMGTTFFRSNSGIKGEEALEGAPDNVTRLFNPASPWVTTGYRSVFSLPISYTLTIQKTSIFDPSNSTLYDASASNMAGLNPTRFLVVDAAIYQLHKVAIKAYFQSYSIKTRIHIMRGEESHKNLTEMTSLVDALCDYGLKRREPFYAIGGGCVLDVCGLAASTYRRGVPFIRVPTTLLSLVDASVGVKNGVDYDCCLTETSYKNRLGTFYPPLAVVCWPGFVKSQDRRNLSNGCGEIVKLALVKSEEVFKLLEEYGGELISTGFGENGEEEIKAAAGRIIEKSIEIMLQELGPNLYEFELERPVDYGHTFSKVVEMAPGADIMHGEAVNVDGFFSAILSFGRGWIDETTLIRIYKVMKGLGLPVASDFMTEENCLKALEDAVEHRHGKQRIPLLKDCIGNSVCVSDITKEEVQGALNFLPYFLMAMGGN